MLTLLLKSELKSITDSENQIFRKLFTSKIRILIISARIWFLIFKIFQPI